MKKVSFLWLFLVFLSVAMGACSANRKEVSEKSSFANLSEKEVIEIIQKVNGYWQSANSKHENAFWHRAAYHTGNMAAYKATGIPAYKDFSEAWAKQNEWKGAKSDERSRWKYSYGESDDFVLFGDWQICFQVYTDLYHLEPAGEKIARAREVMEYQMSTPNEDYWWWVDGLYMVMPVMTRLYKITGNELYLQKLYTYYSYARYLMYDKESRLFYRDAKYIYPKHKTANGLKDFWARGNGWIFAAIPRVLEDLPQTDPHREEYIALFKELAGSLQACQQADGSWTRSLLDPAHAPGCETSGTAFFAYGYIWGVNQGLLDRKEYLPTAEKAWGYLTGTALQPDGKLGYVQPIGEKAIPGQVVDADSTADFGVGAFLLTASELLHFVRNNK